jgi:hypothetical protein
MGLLILGGVFVNAVNFVNSVNWINSGDSRWVEKNPAGE